jgi:FtsP/CotA-like multicopper oxidase with cupredoxin domain
MQTTSLGSLLLRAAGWAAVVVTALIGVAANAAAPGITGPAFNLVARAAYTSQPDGSSVYTWGYGCDGAPVGFAPAAISGGKCGDMQVPGPTLIVAQGATVTVTLTNRLPAAAGKTSILFPGLKVTATGGTAGLLTQEAAVGKSVTYNFLADKPGTYAYHSGTQADLQIEMGLYGAIIVLPGATPAACTGTRNDAARAAMRNPGPDAFVEADFRLAKSAYGHAATCYDREYLFQFSEMDPRIHAAAQAIATCVAAPGVSCPINMNQVETETYKPAYFLINGRSMPDIMDPHYAVQYPRQPYNGNPHMHPGELVLVRIVGHGRWQHPFHEHGNHVRLLARDGNLLLSKSDPTQLAGPLLFTTTTTPGQTMDAIFYWTGKGLNWDVFGHRKNGASDVDAQCIPDANGYYTSDPTAPNFYEWCGDHGKALEAKPFGSVASGGPVTLPDAGILANGPWYGGSPYFGPEAMLRAVGPTPIPPSGTVANDPGEEAGFAYMWHSHNEREITTNNIFPGGMFMMMLVDPRAFKIDESK